MALMEDGSPGAPALQYLTMMLLFMGIVILWDSIPRYWR